MRARLFGGMAVVLLIAMSAAAFAVWQFIEALEVAVIEGALNDRMAEFAAAYQLDPEAQVPRSPALQGFVAARTGPAAIPAWLDGIGPGMHEDVAGDGRTYYVLRHDVGATRLYLVQDIAALRRLEVAVVGTFLAGLVLAVVIAGVVAWAMAGFVLGPVLDLAARIARLDPGQRGVRVGAVEGDREVARIASAFDAYLEQLDAFVAREQAFTGDVSHELRTPLATILSAVQLMLSDPALADDLRLRLQRIERAAGHMHELVIAMLFLARRPDGAQWQACDLGQILEDVVEAHRGTAERRALELRLAVVAPQAVHAPCGMVASVVGNLVGNAVEHASHGIVDVRLQGHTLTVADEGPGIQVQPMARVFERGCRGPDSRGSGLGLALVRRICDHLGWVVDIESREGAGTRVRVTF
ncbi:MAG: HAMP domain-containing histidine kinase [Gammaproteobacteria bacterium]|nr:HAMP domain-containing histidine kinase [Gammaproteobacteria bacterium]